MQHLRRVIALILAIGIAVLTFYVLVLRNPSLAAEPVFTVLTKVGTVTKRVRGIGHVQPVNQVRVSASVSGDLLRLLVREGDDVKKGALLAEIDRQRQAAMVRQNEANTRSLEATVRLEDAQLERAKTEASRSEGLLDKGLATQASHQELVASVVVIEARLESAQQRVESARASLDEARAQLVKTRIVAPIEGTVISLSKKVGERIRGSDLSEDALLTLAPLKAMEVEVEVSEQDVVSLTEGQAAEIEIDALGDRAMTPGSVVEISESAVIKNKGTEMETTCFLVRVALGQIPDGLRSGMSAQVAVLTDTHNEVVAVPIEAVTARLPSALAERAEEVRERGKRRGARSMFGSERDDEEREKAALVTKRRERPIEIVFEVVGGKAEPRRVTTGISSDTEIEIVEGLKQGVEIIVGPYKTLSRTLLPGHPVANVP